jgi:pimeloyl-ACP methyl ester carboxylesterase
VHGLQVWLEGLREESSHPDPVQAEHAHRLLLAVAAQQVPGRSLDQSKVAGLLLLDPASDGRLMPPEVVAELQRSLRDDYHAVVRGYWESMLVGSQPEVRERLLADLDRTPRAVVTGTLDSLLTFDPVTPLRSYAGPRRTVITALNERPDAYQHLVPDLPATKLEGTGHWLQLDGPEQVNALLDSFLAEVR